VLFVETAPSRDLQTNHCQARWPVAKHDFLGDFHAGRQLMILMDRGNACPMCCGGGRLQWPITHKKSTAICSAIDGHQLDERGLAGSVLANQRVNLTCSHPK
jgi:hypothetical protein